MRVKMLIQLILGGLLVYLLVWRWQVATMRFFDVDELSYLHWTANLIKGRKPYIDFFLTVIPGFLWFLLPVVKVFWASAQVLVAGRVVAFLVFLGVLCSLGILWGKTRGWKWALLPVVLLAFLPMPYDKFLEIRPDNLAVLLSLIGVIGEIGAIGGKKLWFLSGVFYSLSLLVLVKTIPFVLVGICISWFSKANRKDFFAGLVVPFVVFFLWTLTLGDVSRTWYSFTQQPMEINKTTVAESMEPNLFFFPNISFYGGWGITAGLLANHALWILGGVFGAFRFFTPFSTADGNKKKVLVELLIGGIFIVSVFGYMRFFPLKHSQYLIPIAVFIAYYAADALVLVLEKLPRVLMSTLIILLGFGIVKTNAEVNAPKLLMSNVIQIEQLKKLMILVPLDTPVLDLEGKMIFWPDTYYICCLSMGTFTPYMSRKPPEIRDTLEENKTEYIYQGDSNRLSQLGSLDEHYINENYMNVSGWGNTLLERKKI